MELTKCPTCLRPYAKQRSNPQNRYYWSVCIRLVSEHTGYSPDEVHEILKHKFLKKTLWIPHNQEGVKEKSDITKSTTELTTAEFEKFLSDIRGWASLCLGCWIPEPNETLIQEGGYANAN